MEARMTAGIGAWKACVLVVGCLLLALPITRAQKNSVASSAESARASLAEKAHALEARGRPDMAIQLWQQILLSAPNNTDALAGLAKDYKLIGSADLANQALDRLRKINPRDPNIGKIESTASTAAQSDQLRQAGELARQGKNDEAMRIYRQLYGEQPPNGAIALAYYQTLYGTSAGKSAAIAGMRSLVDRNPSDPRYVIELGILLTYDAGTRAEGVRILQAHSADPAAQAALRQALIWNSANPSSAAELREYLKSHPQDTEVAGQLKQNEAKLAQMNSGIARNPAERAAFAALNARQINEADKRFTELLQSEPDNGRVEAGMGYVRMQQKNFADAINYLSLAEQNGYKAKTVDEALASSRFYLAMSEATSAFEANQLDVAATKFRAAADMNPRSPDALNGLAGAYTKQQQYIAAAGVYEQLIKVQPASVDGWRGLFLAYARSNLNDKAFAIAARFPAQVTAALNRDPDYLRTLAAIYQAQNRDADAQRVLALALSLPFPGNGSTLLSGTKMQYAGILMEARRYPQAIALYKQLVAADPTDLPAWMGLIAARHESGENAQAIADVERMPPASYEAALGDLNFLSMLAAIYQQSNQYDVAQGMLERAEKLATASGAQPTIALQLQLAGIYLLRNNTDQAYNIYRQVITDHPDNADAWKGLIASLTAANRNGPALQEIEQIPAAIHKQLESDIGFIQTEAGVYAATGDTAHAQQAMGRVQAYYVKLKQLPPPAIDIQNAWLLYSTGSDRALYPALMRIGGRTDLTVAQRETVQEIWANWSVRRAAAAMDDGNAGHAIDILDAASLAFPNNLAVRKAVAGGYARVGRAKEALALYKNLPMQDASPGDFEGAVGAALAANDKAQSEAWLRQALDRFPRDPAILSLAARFEQSRGDNERAADYYRASLAAMPPASPADRLAHALVYPDQDLKVHRAVTAADLQRLLDPDNEPFARTTKVPPLPAYGPDPYEGPAPVATPEIPLPVPQPAPTHPARNIGPQSLNDSPRESFSPAASNHTNAFGAHLVFASFNISRPASNKRHTGFRFGPTRPAVIEAAAAQPAQIETTLNPSHSLASDAWKGLVFSLVAANRNAEALMELSRVPADIRQQLEADIEWVQGVASLYLAVGDTPHAAYYLRRVDNFYLLHPVVLPTAVEIQHAWLLYNARNDAALYPVMQRLDMRTNLSGAERQQVEALWADWAIRRASQDLDAGQLQRGVEILQAAAQDYPNNMLVRRSLAGAYIRAGHAQDALIVYKSIPLDDATAGDFEGAIGAALAAGDMAQCESWLRIALARYSNDPQVLELAARFEQARGNNQRAGEFWRAALAAMPPGTTAKSFSGSFAAPSVPYPPLGPGNTKRLLDPRSNAGPTPEQVAPLPSYAAQSSASSSYVAQPNSPAELQPQRTAPSNNPLPFPVGSSTPGYAPMEQGTVPASQPTYNSPGAYSNDSTSAPVMVEQSVTQPALIQPATSGAAATTPSLDLYTGIVNPVPSEPNAASSNEPVDATSHAPPVSAANTDSQSSTPRANLRIESQPMDSAAADAQAQFANETDSQLTEGSAALIHAVPNAPAGQMPTVQSLPQNQTAYNTAQYAPSAQEAATGAFSAPLQQATAQQPPAATPATAEPSSSAAKPKASSSSATHKREKPAPSASAKSAQSTQEPMQTLGNAPIGGNIPDSAVTNEVVANQSQQPIGTSTEVPAQTTGTGLSDQELEQRNLPPLHGAWIRMQRQANPLSPREQAEEQLRAIESGYSGWLGGTSMLNYRSGTRGYNQLAAIESPFEASTPLGAHARLTAIAKPVFLDSGAAAGTATLAVTESTASGTSLVTIPEPIGTLTSTSTTPPAQQNAAGIGGELQLTFPHLAIAGGYTPANFLVATFTGRFQWRPGDGPFTFSLSRDSVKDSQLSYGGLRDPAGNTLTTLGQIWGGVVANQAQVQFGRGDAQSGLYFAAGGQYLTGYNVESNTRIDGTAGAYLRAFTSPEYGDLSIGANFFAMHYANNQNAFTLGMGGYFSPQAYFLANVPVNWVGHWETHWHYTITGALGVQAFQQNSTPLWPLAAQKALEVSQNNPMLPGLTSVSPNYDLRSEVAYQVGPHWFAGANFAANNTRNYNFASVGFFIRYTFREQPSAVAAPTGLFPVDGLRPFTVP
jgi:tetratricopeptide (TPR) repeat protein